MNNIAAEIQPASFFPKKRITVGMLMPVNNNYNNGDAIFSNAQTHFRQIKYIFYKLDQTAFFGRCRQA